MKVLKMITCALIASYSVVVNAEVTLKADDIIHVLSVNASSPEVTTHGLFSSDRTIHLPNGVNQIVFRYEPYFDADVGDQGRRVTVSSKAIIARFEAKDTELKFEVPYFRSADKAEAQIDNLKWSLIDESGKQVDVVEDVLVKSGIQSGRNYSREAEDYNRHGKGVAVIAPFGGTSMSVAPVAGDADSSATAEEMLLFWYHKADDQTRARFKEYVNQ
jgi:uncharacterized protein YccT (UPF0319 family)